LCVGSWCEANELRMAQRSCFARPNIVVVLKLVGTNCGVHRLYFAILEGVSNFVFEGSIAVNILISCSGRCIECWLPLRTLLRVYLTSKKVCVGVASTGEASTTQVPLRCASCKEGGTSKGLLYVVCLVFCSKNASGLFGNCDKQVWVRFKR